jgi:hypothetical protein
MTTSRQVRDLLLIDLENLIGGSVATEEDVRLAIALTTAVAHSTHHLTVIATGPKLFPATAWSWPPSARRLLGSGLNGADKALLDVLNNEAVDQRFDRLVLASGDAIFADSVAGLASKGLPTAVLARPSALSNKLRLAATTLNLLPEGLVAVVSEAS